MKEYELSNWQWFVVCVVILTVAIVAIAIDFIIKCWDFVVSFVSAAISVTLTGTKSSDVQKALDLHR